MGHLLPVLNEKLLIVGHRLPVLNEESLIMEHRFPALNEPRTTVFKVGLSLQFQAPTVIISYAVK